MSLIDDVIQKNRLQPEKNEITQEFVVRVKVTTDSRDPKAIRAALEEVEAALAKAHPSAQAEVTQVYAK